MARTFVRFAENILQRVLIRFVLMITDVKIYVQWVNMVMIVNRIAVVKMAAHAIRKQAIVTVALVGPDQYVRIDVLSDSGA